MAQVEDESEHYNAHPNHECFSRPWAHHHMKKHCPGRICVPVTCCCMCLIGALISFITLAGTMVTCSQTVVAVLNIPFSKSTEFGSDIVHAKLNRTIGNCSMVPDESMMNCTNISGWPVKIDQADCQFKLKYITGLDSFHILDQYLSCGRDGLTYVNINGRVSNLMVGTSFWQPVTGQTSEYPCSRENPSCMVNETNLTFHLSAGIGCHNASFFELKVNKNKGFVFNQEIQASPLNGVNIALGGVITGFVSGLLDGKLIQCPGNMSRTCQLLCGKNSTLGSVRSANTPVPAKQGECSRDSGSCYLTSCNAALPGNINANCTKNRCLCPEGSCAEDDQCRPCLNTTTGTCQEDYGPFWDHHDYVGCPANLGQTECRNMNHETHFGKCNCKPGTCFSGKTCHEVCGRLIDSAQCWTGRWTSRTCNAYPNTTCITNPGNSYGYCRCPVGTCAVHNECLPQGQVIGTGAAELPRHKVFAARFLGAFALVAGIVAARRRSRHIAEAYEPLLENGLSEK